MNELFEHHTTDNFFGEYKKKNIEDWDEKDCLDWAADAEMELGVPLSSWLSISGFQRVTGRELLSYSYKEFQKLVNEEFGHQFYQLFRNLVKERSLEVQKEIYDDKPMLWEGPSTSTNTNWVVPQGISNDFESQNLLLLTSNDMDDELSNAFVDLPFPPDLVSNSYEELSPFIDELPQNFESSTHFTEFPATGTGSFYSTCVNNADVSSFETQSLLPPLSFDQVYYLGDLTEINESTYQQEYISTNQQEYITTNQHSNLMFNQENSEEISHNNSQNINSSTFNSSDNNTSQPPPQECQQNQEVMNEVFQQFSIKNHPKNKRIKTKTKNAIPLQNFETDDSRPSQECDAKCNNNEPRIKLLQKIPNESRSDRDTHPKVYEYLKRLILLPETRNVYIRWEDRERGEFRLIKPTEVAEIWGSRTTMRKDGPLSYDNFAATIRRHYKTGILLRVEKNFVFRFGPQLLKEIHRLEEQLQLDPEQ